MACKHAALVGLMVGHGDGWGSLAACGDRKARRLGLWVLAGIRLRGSRCLPLCCQAGLLVFVGGGGRLGASCSARKPLSRKALGFCGRNAGARDW